MTTCHKCHGIHTLITPKFCPACGEMLLELPQPKARATAAETYTVTPDQFKAASERLQKQGTLSTADYDSLVPPVDAEINTRLHPGPCPRCGEALEEGVCWRCGMLWELREPTCGRAWERWKHSDPSGETFTPAQMVAAIGQWLEFGERMYGAGVEEAGDFFGLGGRYSAPLRAARDFIQKAGAE